MSAGGDAPGGERRFGSRETRLCDVMTSPIASPDSPTIARAREGRPVSGRPGLPRQTDSPRSTPSRPRRERGQLAPSVALPPTKRRVRIAVALQQPTGRSRGRRQPGECRARSPARPHPTLPAPAQPRSRSLSPEKTPDGPVPLHSSRSAFKLTSVPSRLPARTNRRPRSTRRSSVTPPSSATASPTAAEPDTPPGPRSPSRMCVEGPPTGGPSGGRTSATRERTGAGAGRTDPSATRNATAAGAGAATKGTAAGLEARATSRASTAATRRNPPGREARGSPWAGAGG